LLQDGLSNDSRRSRIENGLRVNEPDGPLYSHEQKRTGNYSVIRHWAK
jgi:hypothetical protein